MVKINKSWMIVLLFLLVPTILAQVPDLYCGDGLCGGGETASNCPVDCRCVTGQVLIFYDDTTAPKEKPAPPITDEVTFFERELIIDETCGYDANLDGLLCDPNEDWLTCPSDCPFPSLDAFFCIGPNCVYKEAWFVRLLLMVLGIGGLVLFIRSRR